MSNDLSEPVELWPWNERAEAATADYKAQTATIDADKSLSELGKAERRDNAKAAYQARILEQQEAARGKLAARRAEIDKALPTCEREEVATARGLLGEAGALRWYEARLARARPADVSARYAALGDDDAWERAAIEALGPGVLAGDEIQSKQLAAVIARRALSVRLREAQRGIDDALAGVDRWDAIKYERELAGRFGIKG